MDTDRRASDRVPDDIPALLVRELGDPDIHAATVRDLGDGGARAVAEVPLPVGAVLYVGFFLQGFGGLPLIAKVRIAWTRPGDGGHMVGLAFLSGGPAQRDSVERMRDYLAAKRRELAGASA